MLGSLIGIVLVLRFGIARALAELLMAAVYILITALMTLPSFFIKGAPKGVPLGGMVGVIIMIVVFGKISTSFKRAIAGRVEYMLRKKAKKGQ
jgi:hypothetical protein